MLHGDCLQVLRTIESASVDAIVTDPPYGLKFMGKKWDYDVPSVEVWRECLRVLKPGGHALIACGTRTQHRMAVNIEDAGFEIRDVITWLYGSGFPKSLDVSKAIDKAAGAERIQKLVPTKPGNKPEQAGDIALGATGMTDISEAVTDLAKQWSGWGTALKPACEFWTLARKPLEGTVAANVLKHGVGGINVDGCRVEFQSDSDERESKTKNQHADFDSGPMTNNVFGKFTNPRGNYNPPGRWPANLILDEEAAALLDAQTGVLKSGGKANASRFFYVAKASKSERNAGLEGMPEIKMDIGDERPSGNSWERRGRAAAQPRANIHPTVKPVNLMRYLCRLITPPGGIVLDPFMGSGSTGVAAKAEGFEFVGIEREKEYFEIAQARMRA